MNRKLSGETIVYLREVRDCGQLPVVWYGGREAPLQAESHRSGWWEAILAAMSAVTAAVIEGFAAHALAMHPEALFPPRGQDSRCDATEDRPQVPPRGSRRAR
jgi:hypothetical protein